MRFALLERDLNRFAIATRKNLTNHEAYWLKESYPEIGSPGYIAIKDRLLGRTNPFLNLYSEEEVFSLSANILEDLIRLNQGTLNPGLFERLIDQLDTLTGDTVSGQLATLACTIDPQRVSRYIHSQSQRILQYVIKSPMLPLESKAFVALRLTGMPDANSNMRIARV